MPREKNPEASPARKRAPRKRAAAAEVARPSFVDPQQRAALTARAAYFRAMNRGFFQQHIDKPMCRANARDFRSMYVCLYVDVFSVRIANKAENRHF